MEEERGEGEEEMMGMSKAAEAAAASWRAACRWLRERRVGELTRQQRRLVEVPHTATLRDTVHALVSNGVSAVPVAAPPGRWIGAGGSMVVELDPATGAVRKHYIGMVTMLDVLIHIAEEEGEDAAAGASPRAGAARARRGGGAAGVDLEQRMSVPVSSVIGHSLEGLSLWTLNPNTSIMDCMEAFSKGVHRALVPLESHVNHVVAAELVESSPGYRMLSQMDVLGFLRSHNNILKDIISCSVGELGAVNESVFSVTTCARVIDALKCMRAASLSSVPIVEVYEDAKDEDVLSQRKGRRLVGTFSATDLRGCPIDLLQSWLSLTVVEFIEKASMHRNTAAAVATNKLRTLVTCYNETSLAQVMQEAMVCRVHRVWVVDRQGLLVGLVSLSDMLRAIRESLLSVEREP